MRNAATGWCDVIVTGGLGQGPNPGSLVAGGLTTTGAIAAAIAGCVDVTVTTAGVDVVWRAAELVVAAHEAGVTVTAAAADVVAVLEAAGLVVDVHEVDPLDVAVTVSTADVTVLERYAEAVVTVVAVAVTGVAARAAATVVVRAADVVVTLEEC